MSVVYKTLFFLFWLFILILFIHPFSGDGDSYHHMNTARLVLQNHAIPQVDEFTFTAKGLPFVGNAWGTGVIYYLIFLTFGASGISILTALLAVTTLYLLYLLLIRYSVPKKIVFFSIFLSVPPLSIRWPNRPETFTYPLIVALLLIDRLKYRHPRLVYFYPLIILAWANLYGANVLFGLNLLVAFLIKDAWLYHFKPKNITIFATLLALLTSYFNGYGFKSIFYILYMPKIAAYDLEWHGIFNLLSKISLDQLLDVQYRVLIYLIYFVIFLILTIFSFKEIFKHIWLAILGLSIFVPFFSYRQIPLITLLTTPFLAQLITYQIKQKKYFILGFVTFLGVVSFAISLWINPPNFISQPNLFPERIVEFIKKHELSGNAFANQRIGPFLTYYLYPKVLVFVDTRDELFLNTEVIEDSIKYRNNFPALLEKYQVDLVAGDLSDGDFYRSLFYSKDWVVVLLYDHYFLIIPRNLARVKNIPVLDNLDPFSYSQAKGGQEEEALKIYQNTPNPQLGDLIRLSHTLIALKKYPEAIEVLSKLNTGFGPRSALYLSGKNYLLAESYLGLGNCLKVKEYLDKTNSNIKDKFIFQPQKKIPSELNKGWAKYFSLCMGDQIKAKTYLHLYLNQSDISPYDKLIFEKEFENSDMGSEQI